MKRDTSNPKPFVDPALAGNPIAARYAANLAARKGGGPVAGGQSPPIPRLDAQAQEGMTMADQARAMRQTSAFHSGQSIIAPPTAGGPDLLMTDLLPESARSDPSYVEGHGSMYAVNQRHLAAKYGIVRNGKHIAPSVLLTGGSPGLRKETVEGLEAVAEFNRRRMQAESPDRVAERAAEGGVAGEAAKLADPSAEPTAKPIGKDEVQQAIENMDDFDFDTFRDLVMKDILNNSEQKEIVEARLKPLDLNEIIDNGTITQVVPIVPGKYEITLQSLTAEEELAMKRLIVAEKGKVDAPDRYLLDKFRMMTCALGLHSVNKRVLPDHKDANGGFSDDAFWRKFNIVMKLPFHMLASIATHYYYFDIRVRSLFKAIKNG